MVQRPRPDLRGGCAVMRIPTATGGRGSATTPPTRPISAFRDKVGAAQRSSPLKETPEQIPPCVFHPTRSMNGSMSPRPQ